MRAQFTGWLVIALSVLCVGGKCGGGSGSGGSGATLEVNNPVCAPLGNPFPPGFDFVPGSDHLVWVADLSPASLLPFDVSGKIPEIPVAPSPFALPFDSDGDGIEEGSAALPLAPIFDDFHAVSDDLALATASSYEEVIFFAPDSGSLRSFDVSVPASFTKGDNPFLVDPGSTEARTGLSTIACVRPPAGTLDSDGVPVSDRFCDAAVPSFYSRFTSGAAIVGDYLFITTSNIGDRPGSFDTQYLPGTVLVYDIDLLAAPPVVGPNELTPMIFTSGFNPTHVTAFETGGRRFALVTVSGAIGIEHDDPSTPEIEAFGLALTDAAIDVIDADTLELVATIPLGLAGLSSDGLVVDPTGRIGVVGSVIGRHLFAVDLAPLETLPGFVVDPVILDGSDGDDAVIFDIDMPFEIPARLDGAPPASCPGFTVGTAFEGSRLFVTEACDGTLAVIDVNLSGPPPVPVPADRFTAVDLIPITAPVRASTLGEPRQPGSVEVRPGSHPGRPNVFFLVGEPDGLLCGIDVN